MKIVAKVYEPESNVTTVFSLRVNLRRKEVEILMKYLPKSREFLEKLALTLEWKALGDGFKNSEFDDFFDTVIA